MRNLLPAEALELWVFLSGVTQEAHATIHWGIIFYLDLDCICFSNKLSRQSEGCPRLVSRRRGTCTSNARSSPSPLLSPVSDSSSSTRHCLLRPLTWYAAALLRAVVCVRFFFHLSQSRSESLPVVSLSSVCINTINRGPLWTADLPVVYVHKRESHVGCSHVRAWGGLTHKTTNGLRTPSNRDYFCFLDHSSPHGSKFASACEK